MPAGTKRKTKKCDEFFIEREHNDRPDDDIKSE